jgi:hypothetical protein
MPLDETPIFFPERSSELVMLDAYLEQLAKLYLG